MLVRWPFAECMLIGDKDVGKVPCPGCPDPCRHTHACLAVSVSASFLSLPNPTVLRGCLLYHTISVHLLTTPLQTSLIIRFTEHKFRPNYLATVGVDVRERLLTTGDKKVMLQLWDTAGQERFRALVHTFYRGAHAVLLTCEPLLRTLLWLLSLSHALW